jgi:hypothetical protein
MVDPGAKQSKAKQYNRQRRSTKYMLGYIYTMATRSLTDYLARVLTSSTTRALVKIGVDAGSLGTMVMRKSRENRFCDERIVS